MRLRCIERSCRFSFIAFSIIDEDPFEDARAVQSSGRRLALTPSCIILVAVPFFLWLAKTLLEFRSSPTDRVERTCRLRVFHDRRAPRLLRPMFLSDAWARVGRLRNSIARRLVRLQQ